jgi:tyrosine-protein phosphatase SIW14
MRSNSLKKLTIVNSIALTCAMFTSVPVWADVTSSRDLPNYHQVNDHVYRGGQPTDDGFHALSRAGIRTIIDLRPEGDENNHSLKHEAEIVEGSGMRYVSMPMHGMATPPPEAIAKLMILLNNENDGPVFIHCKRGADRTGAVIAAYRIQHDQWKNPDALKEAVSLGMSWFQFNMKRFVSGYQPEHAATPAVETAGILPAQSVSAR